MDERLGRMTPTIAAYERFAGAYADKPDDRAWLTPLVRRFAALLPAGALVLDLGCASGRETVELQGAGLRVAGLDIAPAFLRLARERYLALGYVRGDALQLPFASGAFDGVWALASLLHLAPSEAPAALDEIGRVLRPGGVLYCSMQIGTTVGMVPALPYEAVQAERFYTYYEPDVWRALLERAGFEIVHLDAQELTPEQAATMCNLGARGWINTYARTP